MTALRMADGAPSSVSSKMPPSSVFQAKDASSSNDTSMTMERSVRFDVDALSVHLIPHIDDLSGEDRKLIWFEVEDFALMKASNKLVIQLMNSEFDERGNHHPADADDTFCYRGLEHKTNWGAKTRKLAKSNSISAVRKEQARQKKKDNRDEERLREEYRVFTAPCEQRAYKIGRQDAEAAQAALGSGSDHIFTDLPRERPSRRSSLTSGKDWTASSKVAAVPTRKGSTLFRRARKFVNGPAERAA